MAYIDSNEILKILNRNSITKAIYFADGISLYDTIKNLPPADVVPRKAFEQVKWERDTAIEQLKSYGVGFCENANVIKVVRCKDCVHFGKNKKYRDTKFPFSFCDKFHHNITRDDDFCSYGERKEVE